MAYRIRPISALPGTNAKTFPDALRSTVNGFYVEGLGVIGALDADAELHYVFHVPASLPEGTCKLGILAASYNANGSAKINPKWKSVAFEETFDIAAAALNAEGTQTLTWVTDQDTYQMKRLLVNLDADTVVADEFIMLRLVMETSGWTLDSRSIWLPSIVWE